jgi:hypothetical protein
MKLRLPLSIALACCALAFPVAAWAAPAPQCQGATMTQRTAKTIPANLPGFGYSATAATASDVHLVELGSMTDVPLVTGPIVDGRLKVSPVSPLETGTKYELTYEPFCNFAPSPSGPLSFTATAAAPLPTMLGTVSGGPASEVDPLPDATVQRVDRSNDAGCGVGRTTARWSLSAIVVALGAVAIAFARRRHGAGSR